MSLYHINDFFSKNICSIAQLTREEHNANPLPKLIDHFILNVLDISLEEIAKYLFYVNTSTLPFIIKQIIFNCYIIALT